MAKQRKRALRVWVSLRDGKPDEIVWGCTKREAEDQFYWRDVVSATLTLTPPKPRKAKVK